MYLECFPFLEKVRDGGGPKAPICPFVTFFILPLLAGKCPFAKMYYIQMKHTNVKDCSNKRLQHADAQMHLRLREHSLQ